MKQMEEKERTREREKRKIEWNATMFICFHLQLAMWKKKFSFSHPVKNDTAVTTILSPERGAHRFFCCCSGFPLRIGFIESCIFFWWIRNTEYRLKTSICLLSVVLMENILKSPAGCQKSMENIDWQIISSVFASHAIQMLAGNAICLEVWQTELRVALKHLLLCGFGATTISSAAEFPVNRSSLDVLYPWCKMCVQCSKRIANELIVCKYQNK